MLRKSLQHICTSLEIEEALTSIGLLATVSDQCVQLLFNFFVCFFALGKLHFRYFVSKDCANPSELLMFTVKT